MKFQKQIIISILSSVIIFSSSVNAEEVALASAGEGFTAGEHVTLGDAIQLHSLSNRILRMPNGLKLTYGDIMSLGDFYGTPKSPISYGKTPEERTRLFLLAFDTFSVTRPAVIEVQKILEVTHEEQSVIQNAILHGERVEDAYKRIGDDHGRRYNCITGGGCSTNWWLNEGRYLKLAKTDYDHFGGDAFIAYQVGHEAAIEEAVLAHEQRDLSKLEIAYAMNAFACHFLSDRFSSGHIRTPRYMLDKHTTPAVVGSLLASYMHNEESQFGLHVHNARGDRWVAYGDKHYFDMDAARHRELLLEVLQLSADEVHAAFVNGLHANSSEVQNLIPFSDYVDGQMGNDIAPMFYWDEQQSKLLRRDDLAKPFDFHFKADWWGWSTLTELSYLHGLPHELQKNS